MQFSGTKEPVSDLKTMKTESQVSDTMSKFLPADPALRAQLLERLKEIRRNLEASDFFMRHEVCTLLLFYFVSKTGMTMAAVMIAIVVLVFVAVVVVGTPRGDRLNRK